MQLFFNDVRVPTANLLGHDEGRGFIQLMEQLPQERLQIAAQTDDKVQQATLMKREAEAAKQAEIEARRAARQAKVTAAKAQEAAEDAEAAIERNERAIEITKRAAENESLNEEERQVAKEEMQAAMVAVEQRYGFSLARRFPVVALCQYDVRVFSGTAVLGALKCHEDTFRFPLSRFLSP